MFRHSARRIVEPQDRDDDALGIRHRKLKLALRGLEGKTTDPYLAG